MTVDRLIAEAAIPNEMAIEERDREECDGRWNRKPPKRPRDCREDHVELHFDREAPEHGVRDAVSVVEEVLNEEGVREEVREQTVMVDVFDGEEERRNERDRIRRNDLEEPASSELGERLEIDRLAECLERVREEQHEAADREEQIDAEVPVPRQNVYRQTVAEDRELGREPRKEPRVVCDHEQDRDTPQAVDGLRAAANVFPHTRLFVARRSGPPRERRAY